MSDVRGRCCGGSKRVLEEVGKAVYPEGGEFFGCKRFGTKAFEALGACSSEGVRSANQKRNPYGKPEDAGRDGETFSEG